MGNQSENIPQNHLCVGILAHVDAGKTTLAESILYKSGKIRKFGRVDHGDTFLDTLELERSRGITIFSKQAEVAWKEKSITLLDTPGHVDFSAEMERTLRILDYAVLVISGADGVQGHVQTLWKLLKRYEIPVFLFINKMDQNGVEKEAVLAELQRRLDTKCIDFSFEDAGKDEGSRDEWFEEVAMCDDTLLEQYLEGEKITVHDIQVLIQKRKIYPCYFGSALKQVGIEEFLDGFVKYTVSPEYPREFGAKVYKISRDRQGTRLTHLKVTGGSLKVKSLLKEEEKADQIRIYSGNGFTSVQEAAAGQVCAVTGLNSTCCGEG